MPNSYSDPSFLQTTDLTLIGPLFTQTSKTTEAKSDQWKLSAKCPHFHFLKLFLMLPAKPDETEVPFFSFFPAMRLFSICLSPKCPSFDFIEVSARKIQIEAL